MINHFPSEIMLHIFSYLDIETLKASCQVAKSWSILANKDEVWQTLIYKELAFNEERWKSFGKVEQAPVLPKNIKQIWKDAYTAIKIPLHLIFMPKTINDQPLTLNKFSELLMHKNVTCEIVLFVAQQFGSISVSESHWVLVTKKIIPETLNKTYDEHQSFINQLTKKTSLECRVAKLLEVAINSWLQPDNTDCVVYTHCQEQVQSPVLITDKELPSFTNFIDKKISIGCYNKEKAHNIGIKVSINL